ncbi:mechanosensitive ion channel family protein [uncultured Clostridium sp.]|jgi:small conductance mechanosensitive channel|uniref:mechanosensitive ion channel family protein n=1 Tax=uncultured Clostridium sp. TaxID=59620 RepID=UPI0026102754|nr:mechanosensitive ion channel family protein [uncultured Clostridium sp.]
MPSAKVPVKEVKDSIIQILGIPINMNIINDIIFKLIMIIIVLVAMVFIIKIGNKVIGKVIEKQIDKNNKFSINIGERKANTLGTLLKSILKYFTYIMGIISIAGIIVGGTISLAFASVGGVALGLGAQSFVKDIINGVFILFENQYNVGDYITIDRYTGIVESIEIRSTTIREFSGSYHIIPNGIINVVTNHSMGNMQIKVEVEIAYEASIDKAKAIIEEVCESFERYSEDVTKRPVVVGVTALGASGMTIKVLGEVKAMNQWKLEAKLRELIKEALDGADIEIPYNKLQILNVNKVESKEEVGVK